MSSLFFEFYSDIAAESRRYYEQLGVEHAWESKTIKDAIVLLFMECWLRRCTADICDCRLPGYLKKIMDGAYRALKQEQELLKAICAAAYGSVYADDRSEAAALDALTRDAEEMSGMSAVSTVIMLEGKI